MDRLALILTLISGSLIATAIAMVGVSLGYGTAWAIVIGIAAGFLLAWPTSHMVARQIQQHLADWSPKSNSAKYGRGQNSTESNA